jgi:hypothetical protein
MLDHARSTQPWVDALQPHLARTDCVAAPGLPPALLAALELHGGWRVDGRPQPLAAITCPLRVAVARGAGRTASLAPAPGWTLVATVRRPTERDEITSVWRRSGP